MIRASTRHVGLGIAGALATSTRDVARLSLWAAKAGSRTPLVAPLRGPARKIVDAAEHRGALNEARLLSDAGHASAEWFARAVRGPLLDHAVRALVDAEVPERVLKTAAEQGSGARTADADLSGDRFERPALHVTEQPAGERLTEPILANRSAQAATDDRLAGPARPRLHRQARPALFAGFEDGAAPP